MSRPPTTLMRSRYPALNDFRIAMKEWCRDKPSLVEAARELGCTYRELSNYRHGQRWPPDRIVKFFGFNPEELRDQQRAGVQISKARKKTKEADRVVDAACDFVLSVRGLARAEEQKFLTNEFFEAVKEYLKPDKSRSV